MILLFNDIVRKHYDMVVVFAEKQNLLGDLQQRLEQLENMAHSSFASDGCVFLSKDFAPMSFTFSTGVLHDMSDRVGVNGGLIYSGPVGDEIVRLDGSAPSFTVSLGETKVGWSIHT